MLALFDLDGFKQYNDSFGHPAGDALLVRLAERLKTATEGLGSVYRMGGDEFCLLAAVAPGGGDELAAAGRRGAQRHRPRLRDQLLARPRPHPGRGGDGGGGPAAGRPAHVRAQGRPADDRAREHRPPAAGHHRTRGGARRACDRGRPARRRHRRPPRAPRRTRSGASGWPPSCTTSARPRSRTPSSTSPARSPMRSGGSCAATP